MNQNGTGMLFHHVTRTAISCTHCAGSLHYQPSRAACGYAAFYLGPCCGEASLESPHTAQPHLVLPVPRLRFVSRLLDSHVLTNYDRYFVEDTEENYGQNCVMIFSIKH
jgi:hypothetical protein